MRNPFHCYEEYGYAKQKTDEIFEQMRDRSVVIPYLKNPNNTDVAGVYRRADCNMNYAYDKGSFTGNPFPTAEYIGESDIYVRREKASFKKSGDLIYRQSFNPTFDADTNEWLYDCYSPKFRPITDDIQTLYELCRDYRQVSAGKNHYERQVIVGDFDIDFEANTIDSLNYICEVNNIPHFTYLERHLDSNHYQVGWVLDQPLIVKNCYGRFTFEHILYLDLIKKIAQLFGSDPNYKGWWIKNPNCERLTDARWFNDTVSKDAFLTAFENISVLPIPKTCSSADKPKRGKVADSRNDYLMQRLREWIWDRMRNGNKPSIREASEEGRRIAAEAGSITQKGKQQRFEIEATIYSVYRWALLKFKPVRPMEVPLNYWVSKAKKEIKLINTYEVFKRHCEEGLSFAANGNLKKSEIVKEVAKVNNEDERSARDHLKYVMGTAHLGGVSDRYIKLLSGFLWTEGKKGPKVSEYLKMCQTAEDKYQMLFEDYIEEQAAMDSVECIDYEEAV